jgi:hypothetical protein
MRLVALVAIAGLVGAWTAVRPGATAGRSSCPATMVRYQPAKHPTLGENPWVLAQPSTAAVLGFLPNYPQLLRDRRVNRSDGLVVWRTGTQIVWHTASGSPTVTAQPLGGGRSVRLTSPLRFPASGCWELTARAGGKTARVVARVVEAPAKLGCDATRLDRETRFALARPLSSGIAGGWNTGWTTRDGGALMYTHGHGPGNSNAKVPWWVRQASAKTLDLPGTRLDGPGTFSQSFPAALGFSSHPPGYLAVFPSTVNVPRAGCWLFRLRTAQLAGVLVVRAVDRTG